MGEWVRLRLRTLLEAISLKEPVFTAVLHCLAAPANLDGVLKELEKARSNQLEMMHALGFVMQYRAACAPPGPSLRKPALLQKSDLRNHQAIVQPPLYDSLMVTQITLNTEPHGFDSCQGHCTKKLLSRVSRVVPFEPTRRRLAHLIRSP